MRPRVPAKAVPRLVRLGKKMQPTKPALWPIAHFQAQVPHSKLFSFISRLPGWGLLREPPVPLSTLRIEPQAPTCWACTHVLCKSCLFCPGPVLSLGKTSWLLFAPYLCPTTGEQRLGGYNIKMNFSALPVVSWEKKPWVPSPNVLQDYPLQSPSAEN